MVGLRPKRSQKGPATSENSHAAPTLMGIEVELGKFTIQIRYYDSKSLFLMSRESPIHCSIESIPFFTQPFLFSCD